MPSRLLHVLAFTLLSSLLSLTVVADENIFKTKYSNETIISDDADEEEAQQEFKPKFNFLITIGFSGLALNLIGVLCIFYHTYLQWKAQTSSMKMYYRLPFYIAITDLSIIITHFLNMIHPVIYRTPWPNPFCNLLGLTIEVTQCLNQFLFSIVAVSIYLKVSKNSKIDFGKYDWKLFTGMIVLTSLFSIPPLKSDGYGAQQVWCGLKPGRQFVTLYFFLLATVNLLVTTVCYVQILSKLKQSRCDLVSSRHQTKNVEDRVTKKIALHVLVFLLQWLPVNLYTITFFFGTSDFWIMVVAAIGINMGGIGNALAYAYNIDLFQRHPDETGKQKWGGLIVDN
ncbi:6813_t:CDS:2 [Ambispora gerdemannii]|uniref:6813_t:CDS:1 n=1 Tax=Ambispora gerdemannii TaxID=144530 RepID=A0A9N8VQJ9_9GLOM|nr:6813_t:CDS:2 [Ambispora gerdemannii]